MSEAIALFKQLMALGASYQQALLDAATAMEIDPELLVQCYLEQIN